MSIHTILSQEIDKIAAKGLELSDNDLWKYYRGEEFFDDLRSLATRIVEEVGNELIGEYEQVEYGGDEFNAPDIDHNAIARNDLRKEQRTKLQKMKG